MKKPIYYITGRAIFKKGKKTHKKNVWIVSVFDDVNSINNKDKRTINRLRREEFGKKWEEGMARLVKIYTKKQVGITNG